MILLIVYFILGYWSVGRTIYGNLIAYTDGFNLFLKKVSLCNLSGMDHHSMGTAENVVWKIKTTPDYLLCI